MCSAVYGGGGRQCVEWYGTLPSHVVNPTFGYVGACNRARGTFACVVLQASRPVMGIVQDALLGSHKITQRDVFIERDLMMNMVMWMQHWEGYIPPPAVMLPTKGHPGKCNRWKPLRRVPCHLA